LLSDALLETHMHTRPDSALCIQELCFERSYEAKNAVMTVLKWCSDRRVEKDTKHANSTLKVMHRATDKEAGEPLMGSSVRVPPSRALPVDQEYYQDDLIWI